MNTLTDEQMNLAARLSKNKDVYNWLMSEDTEWRAVVCFQNGLECDNCMKYISNLDKRGCTTGNATIEQRVEAFIQTMLRR